MNRCMNEQILEVCGGCEDRSNLTVTMLGAISITLETSIRKLYGGNRGLCTSTR